MGRVPGYQESCTNNILRNIQTIHVMIMGGGDNMRSDNGIIGRVRPNLLLNNLPNASSQVGRRTTTWEQNPSGQTAVTTSRTDN